jgi:hypothetical protein
MIGKLIPTRIRKRDYTSYDGPRRWPGRPRKKVSTSPTGTPRNAKRSAALTNWNSKRRGTKRPFELSLLERLPTELLQDIFLKSMNVKLPLTSRILKTKLSREGLQLDMSIRMLCTHREELGQKERSKLLACQFFTYDFLLKFAHRAHNYSIGLTAVAKIFAHHLDSYDVENNPKMYTFHPLFQRSMTLEDVQHHQWCPQGLVGVYIPEKLLHGPWTMEKKLFFNYLREAGCTIDPKSTAPEVATVEVFKALREGEHEIVLQLIGGEGEEGLVPVTHDILRSAILEGRYSREVIRALLYRPVDEGSTNMGDRAGDLDFFDPDLWAWIERERSDGDINEAEWLQHVLETEGASLHFPL